tara:strand:- start:14526 stop:14669 length:144 start_codon:yes stop_codon:yes gene_type:complete
MVYSVPDRRESSGHKKGPSGLKALPVWLDRSELVGPNHIFAMFLICT